MPTKPSAEIIPFASVRSGQTDATEIRSKSSEIVEWNARFKGDKNLSKNNEGSDECRVSNYVNDDKERHVVSSRKKGIIPVSDHEANATRDHIFHDIAKRSKELPTLYPANYAAWEWMNRRGIDRTAEVHRPWQRHRGQNGFANFLRDMADAGIKRVESHTLHRMETNNPLYAPGMVRFVDPKEQANATPRNKLVLDPATNEWTTATLAAERHGLKPSTILKALERGENPAEVIAERLRKQSRTTPRGKRDFTPHKEQDAPPPPAPVPQANDPTKRWPWALTGAQRDSWNNRYLNERKYDPDTGLYEWRHEFALRFLAGELHRAGFNVIGRPGSTNGVLAQMRASWSGDEPNAEEEATYAEADDYFQKCRERLDELLAKLPDIKPSLVGKEREKNREHKRTFTHYHVNAE